MMEENPLPSTTFFHLKQAKKEKIGFYSGIVPRQKEEVFIWQKQPDLKKSTLRVP